MCTDKDLELYSLQLSYRQYSYDLVQKLTFFVISIELIICGYMLLNSEKFGEIEYSSLLFLCGGIAAVFGLLWRFFYNQNIYENAHPDSGSQSNDIGQGLAYWAYVAFTMIFFISIVTIGFIHIYEIEQNVKIGVTINQNQTFQIIGLLSNFLGTVILAFSANSYFRWLNLSIFAHETSINTIIGKGDVILAGTDKHSNSSQKQSKKWMMLGIVLIVIGFAIQLVPIITAIKNV